MVFTYTDSYKLIQQMQNDKIKFNLNHLDFLGLLPMSPN